MTQYHSNEMNNAEICIDRRVQLLKYGVKCNTVNHPFHTHPYRFRAPLGGWGTRKFEVKIKRLLKKCEKCELIILVKNEKS